MLAPLIFALSLTAAPPDLRTEAEKTSFTETGRYAEVERLCPAYAKAFPGRARCLTFGSSPEGRPMLALAASADGVLDAASARSRKRPVVLLQGGIHAGEIDGKDAGFLALRELLERGKAGPLAKVTALFIPVYNVDGHERFGPHGRPNQRGPAEMGWRTTSQNHNLNRDYTKADAPETVALLQLLGAWDPIVYADLHVTDGAQFEHDVGILVAPRHGGAEALRPEGAALEEALVARLGAAGYLPLPFYPAFVEHENPASGIALGVPLARFGNGYWAERNRIGILVETHSWRPYPHRVELTRRFIHALLELAAERGGRWTAAAARADDAATALAGKPLAVAWTTTNRTRTIDFRGYAYVREPSPVSGRLVTRYDETRPATWKLPLFDELVPLTTVTLPRGGWIVPAAHADWMAEKLRLHGVRFERLARAHAGLAAEVFHAKETKLDASSFEGRQRLTVTGEWTPGQDDLAPGALFVPAAQPAARLAAQLLEPTAPDSFLAWGCFNNAFERKEYLEAYVADAWARELLARDPSVKAEFEQRLATDAEFAKSPEERLLFFYRRHPSWDVRYQRYPVVRVAARPGA
jgi:murein tripeptide amidase MpaA